MTPEKAILHKSYRKIQQRRINNLSNEIDKLKSSNIKIYLQTLEHNKERFRVKIRHVINKFNPDRVRNIESTSHRKNNKKNSNRISRERYQSRRYREKLNRYINNEGNTNVYNLSSTNLLVEDLFALELGHGFIPSLNNSLFEEETLILEGFRFIDRIGRIDTDISTPESINNRNSSSSHDNIPNLNIVDSDHNFIRDKSVPLTLKFSQLIEKDLKISETKLITQEFTRLNDEILSNLESNRKRQFNLPKKAKESILRLKNFVRNKKIDIRKVDKSQIILIIDYEQRLKTEELNISTISSLCETQTSNWQENIEFSNKLMKGLWNANFISDSELTAVTGLLAGGRNG